MLSSTDRHVVGSEKLLRADGDHLRYARRVVRDVRLEHDLDGRPGVLQGQQASDGFHHAAVRDELARGLGPVGIEAANDYQHVPSLRVENPGNQRVVLPWRGAAIELL